jgi:hypothetical protein
MTEGEKILWSAAYVAELGRSGRIDEACTAAVRLGANPNPWRNSTDEEIAAEILRRVKNREGMASGLDASP